MKSRILRLVVDANILISALVKNSITRKLILEAPAYFYTPNVLVEEINNNIETISKKNKLSVPENQEILKKLLEYVTVVEQKIYEPELKPAYNIMKNIDAKDTPYLALALSIKNDGIWTEDTDFDRQKTVRVWKTKDVLKLI